MLAPEVLVLRMLVDAGDVAMLDLGLRGRQV